MTPCWGDNPGDITERVCSAPMFHRATGDKPCGHANDTAYPARTRTFRAEPCTRTNRLAVESHLGSGLPHLKFAPPKGFPSSTDPIAAMPRRRVARCADVTRIMHPPRH